MVWLFSFRDMALIRSASFALIVVEILFYLKKGGSRMKNLLKKRPKRVLSIPDSRRRGIKVYLTAKEIKKIRGSAHDLGLTVSEFLRAMGLSGGLK